jgi:hypothetical protein
MVERRVGDPCRGYCGRTHDDPKCPSHVAADQDYETAERIANEILERGMSQVLDREFEALARALLAFASERDRER